MHGIWCRAKIVFVVAVFVFVCLFVLIVNFPFPPPPLPRSPPPPPSHQPLLSFHPSSSVPHFPAPHPEPPFLGHCHDTQLCVLFDTILHTCPRLIGFFDWWSMRSSEHGIDCRSPPRWVPNPSHASLPPLSPPSLWAPSHFRWADLAAAGAQRVPCICSVVANLLLVRFLTFVLNGHVTASLPVTWSSCRGGWAGAVLGLIRLALCSLTAVWTFNSQRHGWKFWLMNPIVSRGWERCSP